jgi:L-iditol 2-dehydrogenase
MRAAVFEGPGRIEVHEVATPGCGRDEVLVRVKACGICGSDVRNYRAGLRGGVTRQIIGHEIAGVVEEVGADCARLSPGDPLAIAPDVSCGTCHYCRQGLVNLCVDHRMIGTHWPGGFAQFLRLPREVLERGMVHRIPAGVSFRDAALAEPLSSVLASQKTAGIGPGQAVAVFGAGAVGCLHVEIARARGASPVVLVGRRRLQLAAAFRPDLLVQVADRDPGAAIREATGGLGADVAIIAAPSAEMLEKGVASVRKRGTVVLFAGLPRDDPCVRLDANRIHYDELRLVGSFSYPSARHAEALEAIRDGRISAQSVVTRVVGLDGITESILAAERGEVLKVVVDPWL